MNANSMARNATQYERLDLISTIAQKQGLNVSAYVQDAVISAVALDLHLRPYEIAQLGINGSDMYELIRLVAEQSEMTVADYIGKSVIKALADDMCMTSSQLEDVLEKVESWSPVLC